MNQYYVVIRKKEKDELKDGVGALSLEEAFAIAKVSYGEGMREKEGLFVFSAIEPITFDKNHRFINNSDGNIKICIKL
ncbi:hypothetical protein [Ureibacillus aquaedulcis]|uniref:Uncharacterized protein n=1 Tax=Ureibacillus aquaedulcis TaxID=3058421 RepID=A0ABT8GNV4_9BACL|nr:hypothetical protein [Ureibacillus sp. BA0131]MDN4493090.1 hypothetical protein [Ureibacillus sp. BA0131]